MILKNLLRRVTRSILTIAGIAIGVAAVVAIGRNVTRDRQELYKYG
ncbi:MAG: hypothetical protein R2932_06975 [Caldilineaceae bacterium]